jgi:DNA-binding protein HU-beta
LGFEEVEGDADAGDSPSGRQDRHQQEAGKVRLDEFNELVTRQLKKEGSLRLAGLGVFRKRKLKARIGRNPATGEQIKIPARTRLRFTPAKSLKDLVLGAR